MKNRKYINGFLLVGVIAFISYCASTKTATIPQGWSYDVNWDSFNSAEVTQSDHIIVQNKEDMIMLDGTSGRVIENDIRERGGFFSEIGRTYKEQVKEDLLLSQRVELKYFHKELPELNTILLFNRVEEGDEVRSLNLETGEENWTSTTFVWNMDKYQDIANIAINNLMGGSLGAKGMSAVALQTRLIESMIEEVPEKDAFLFRSVERLYLIDSPAGEILWESEEVDGTGIAAVEYLPQADQLLMATSMSGLKDMLENADEEQSFKQILLIDAGTGDVIWQSDYKGRSEQVKSITKVDSNVHLDFFGGSVEVFDFTDGHRIFGTRDGNLEGDTKLASFTTDYNLVETPETATPLFDTDAVYAVNPVEVKAVGVPDKQLQKIDITTGDPIWQATLESTPDIRQMYLTENDVVVRLSSSSPDTMSGNVSNIVGKVKELGFYAFSKEDGSLSWKLTKPFENHVTNVIYGEDNIAWAAGDESLYKFDLTNGNTLVDSTYSDYDLGEAKYIYEAGDRIIVIGFKGMVVVDRSDLRVLYSRPFEGKLVNFEINDQFLATKSRRVLSGKETLYVFNLSSPSEITSFSLTPPKEKKYGKLGFNGYHPTHDFKQLITLTEHGITSYKVY